MGLSLILIIAVGASFVLLLLIRTFKKKPLEVVNDNSIFHTKISESAVCGCAAHKRLSPDLLDVSVFVEDFCQNPSKYLEEQKRFGQRILLIDKEGGLVACVVCAPDFVTLQKADEQARSALRWPDPFE